MAERNEKKKSKGSKGNEGEEGTDGAKQKGGGGGGGEKDQPQHKRSRLGGAAHFVHKRVTELGQPKSTPKKKEGKSDPHFDTPPPPPNTEPKGPQQQQGSTWNPTPWENTPPNDPESTDPVQPIASGAVIPSTEEMQSDDIVLPTSEGTTPTAMKYDTNITTDDANVSSFVPEPVAPQQSSDDDVELSLKLARIEIENKRHKRELKDKERQIKEYEDEIILLRTQIKSGGGGVQAVVVDQSATQKLTSTIQQLEREKEELMKGKEELAEEKEELTKEKEELLTKNEKLKDGMEQERERLRKETEEKVAEEKTKLEQENNQLKEELTKEETLKEELKEELRKEKEELRKEKEKLIEEKGELKEELTKIQGQHEVLNEENEGIKEELTKLKREHEVLNKENKGIKEELTKLKGENEKLMREKVTLTREKEELTKEKEELIKGVEDRKKDEDQITHLTQLLEEEKEERRKVEEHTTESEKKHAIELEGVKQQLDTQIAEKKQLEMDYQQKYEQEKEQYEAQMKQYKEEMDGKMQLHEETAAKIKQKEATAKAQDKKEEEAVLKEVEDLRNEVKMRRLDIETLEKEAEIRNDAYKKLEAQLKEREDEIETRVNEKVREGIDKHLREAVKAQLTTQQIDEQRKVFAAHLKEKEEKAKTQYEVLLASKDRRIKELGDELEEKMEQLKQKEEVEHNLREEITNLQLKVEAGDGASANNTSANNSLSEEDKMRRELEDKAARVSDLEEMVGKLEKDKREVEQNFEKKLTKQLEKKDEEIQKLTEEVDYFKGQQKVQNNALLVSAELKESLEENEKQLADTKKAVDELGGELSKKGVEIDELNDLLAEKEEEIVRLKEERTTKAQLALKEKEQTIRQLREQLDEAVKKSNTQKLQIEELVDKIQIKEAENAVYKQDFETERNDRQRIHAEYEELRTKTEGSRMQHKADKEAMANLAEVMRGQEEEIQVLTAQVNAYSREVDKQKGLVTQNQEKHKTEVVGLKSQINELQSSQQQVSELKESLANERKSKQQLAGELASMRQQLDHVTRTNQQLDNELVRMRQQLDNVLASKEELLRAYHEERAMVTRLEDQVEKTKQANKVLVDKLKSNNASSASASSNQAHISSRRNDVPSGNYYQMSAQASSGPSVKEEELVEQGDEMHRSNRAYSDHPNEKPQFTAEEMAALFKKPAQPAYYEMESGYDEQEAEEEKKKIDKELEEIDQLRQQNPLVPLPSGSAPSSPRLRTQYAHQDQSHQDSSQPSQGLPEASDEVIQDSKTTGNDDRPYDPNLICPKCGKQYRVGEIQKLRRHINEKCTA